jgi:hypothetical protein
MVKKDDVSTEAQFSYDDIQDAYENDLLPELKKAARAMQPHSTHFAKMGFTIPNLDGLKGEICKDWPMIKQFVDTVAGIPFLTAFVPALGGVIATVKGFVAMLDKGVIPQICKVATATTGIGSQGGSQR